MPRRWCRRFRSPRTCTRSFASRFDSGSSSRNACGLADQRAPHRDALTLAAGELRRPPLRAGRRSRASRDTSRDAPLDLGLRRLALLQPERQVLVDGHVRVERVVLEHHRDVAVARRDVVDHAVADRDRAGRDLLQPGHHPQRGGLPAPGRPDEDHELAVGDREREVAHAPRCRRGTPWRRGRTSVRACSAFQSRRRDAADEEPLRDEEQEQDRHARSSRSPPSAGSCSSGARPGTWSARAAASCCSGCRS